MTLHELDKKYFVTRTMRHTRGADKGDKVRCERVWRDNVTPAQYLNELAGADSLACGRLLCEVEKSDLLTDRWWDVPGYRVEHLTMYRRRITEIRKRYGMTSKDVAEFMRVG